MPLASPLLAFAIVRLCFAQFYFENHQSVLGSRGPASSSAHTKTAITAIDAEHGLHDGRADADGAMPSACSSGGGGVTLQTVCRVKAVNSAAIWARPTAHHCPPRV